MVMAEYVTRNRTPIKVGFYDIVRTIGRGNFAVVKLARHRITKTEVAIKIIDKLRLDQLNLKKIYREIQILKLLNHQHIIKLYQVMETSSTIYLVCEYARNGELFDYITEQGRLPEAKAKKMFWQVLTAVEYCHKNNVVHRDLKAENLLLDSNNNIKLADFGFSNFYQSGSMLSTWCGSPPYAAPEVFEGKLYDGPHLDVWSLGVVLYVLVCGTFPFDGSNLATLKDRVLGGRFRIPYWMSQDCENLVRHMLVINPKKRLTITQIKKHTWMQECNPELALPQSKASPSLPRRGKLSEYNEHVLKIMQGLGINRQKALESLSLSAYDHLYAIYHLLADRLKLHRTSFPLEENISYDTGRRRPSNVADQAVCSMTKVAPMLPVHQEQNDVIQGHVAVENAALPSSIPDVKFEDMTTGLPTVPHSLNAPVRYSSPPLPQIRTSMYDDATSLESTNASQISPPNPAYLACQNEENSSVPNNNPNNSSFRTADYHHGGMDNEEPNLRNYNLHQRRHTLMVPNPSQIQMLRAGMGAVGQISPQHSPHTSTVKLCHSGDEMSQHNFPTNQFLAIDSPSNQNCEGSSCNNPMCGCRQGGINFTSNKANLLLPCKTLPTAPDFSFNSHKVDARPHMRRRSGAPAILTNLNLNDAKPRERESQELKAAFIIRQRQQLDSSPIGFRQGRRASDGLLLLGDNMLKEHWQKLARTSGVPEMTSEDPEENLEGGHNASESNRLQLPLHNQVNRTKSAERNFPQPQSSPGSTPGGSGSNISYQPYNNSQSLARRRSLHAQNIQIRGASPTITANTEAHESMLVTGNQPPQVHQQQPYATKIPSPLLQGAIERPAYIQTSANDTQAPCQWSSWKPVQGNSPDGNKEVTPTMWQKLSMAKSGTGWNESDFNTLSVASDEAVSSKAAAAQEQQRDSKPIRQQSLPISPTNNNHPFGSGQHPTMAQILQHRRLQRRLKVAATHQQMIAGYQLPLPELEQLRIDNTSVFGHLHVVPPNSSATDNIPHSQFPTKQPTEQEHMEQWNQQYTTSMADEALGTEYHFSNNKDVINFEKADQSDESRYQGFHGPMRQSNPIPIALLESKGDPQFSWSYDMPRFHYKSFEFDSSILANENLSNSAERLEHAGSETMEFTIY